MVVLGKVAELIKFDKYNLLKILQSIFFRLEK